MFSNPAKFSSSHKKSNDCDHIPPTYDVSNNIKKWMQNNQWLGLRPRHIFNIKGFVWSLVFFWEWAVDIDVFQYAVVLYTMFDHYPCRKTVNHWGTATIRVKVYIMIHTDLLYWGTRLTIFNNLDCFSFVHERKYYLDLYLLRWHEGKISRFKQPDRTVGV